MRTLTSFSLGLLISPLAAQTLTNPDFHTSDCGIDDTGWSVPGWNFTDSGYVCAALEYSEASGTDAAYASIFGMQPETPYILTFWARRNAIPVTGSVAVLGFGEGESPGSGADPFWGAEVDLTALTSTEWTQLTVLWYSPSTLPAMDNYVRVSPYGPDALALVRFDEFQMQELSSGMAVPKHGPIGCRPNPATDKLQIDLPEVPLAIVAIDAGGRAHDLKNFTHLERTLEVDVTAFPDGICLLRLTTASGTRIVRFVKA